MSEEKMKKCSSMTVASTKASMDINIYCNIDGEDLFDPEVLKLYQHAFNRAADDLHLELKRINILKDPETKRNKEALKKEFVNSFFNAGLDMFFVQELPNQYSDGPGFLDSPWFNIGCEIGNIMVGWRSSVINLDYSGLYVEKKIDLFKEDNVSSGESYVHCLNYDHLSNCLEILKKHKKMKVSCPR